ncbi:MAG: aldehyde oxidase [Elusimicrobia bacterium CG_4_10_14_0_2_um_filter_56_8]|nr:MAG: aldehyde oxidase [Elusimicrobia bacterium CG1_02_56_21]PJA17079.1 MAG: aldehyde oxidase [Elusimicrobia bacterium CG_4_10_14_0_2_um_filter_56_8]
MDAKDLKVVNKPVVKMDSMGLACGEPAFTDDVEFKGLLTAKILWSPHAHARIKKIDVSAALKVPGVKAVLTYKDLPRVPHTTAGQGYPEPSPYDTYTLDNKVRFVGDRVAAVAAETPEAAQEALSRIKVDYEILPAVLDTAEAMKEGAPVIHDEEDSKNIPDAKHNIAAKFEFQVKNGEWFKEADFVFEHTWSIPYLQHCALEPHVTIAHFDNAGRLVLRTSTQVPFHVRRIVAQALKIPVKKIRVVKPRIGGGFGSKQEVLLEDITAALALKTGRPVKLEYTRKETFISSRTRHPSRVRMKAGVKKDGTITDAAMEITLNTGAYGSHALTVMMCAGSHTLPMYRIKNNIRFVGKSVYTNMPVAGAYRGYGATQGFFAWECLMDMMAAKIGMDPVEFRKMNYIKLGEGSPVFKAMGEGREGVEQVITSTGLFEAIEKGVDEIKWTEKKAEYAKQTGPIRRGLGAACMMQGSGIPEVDMASATIKMNEDGSFNLLAGAADLGTGSDTVLAQIAAEVLGIKADDIIVTSSDTDITPFDVGAYASSTTFISGGAVKKAAEKVRDMIIEVGARILDEKKEDLRLECGKVVSKSGASCPLSEVANTSLYYYNQHQITASASHFAQSSPPPFQANFADVEVDTETGVVKILDYVSCVDCGTAINPVLAEGQNDGAVLNGISHTLSEEMEFSSNGTPLNASFRRYKILSAADTPRLRTFIIPTWEPAGPFGAKSVSEIGINGPLPAVANAIYDACGVWLFDAPFTPDRVLKAIKQRR